MKRLLMFVLVVVSLFSMYASGASESSVADYPKKPIQVIVGYGSGGDSDVNTRVFSKYLEKEIGQTVIVSNVAGAAGSVGARQVLDSEPDGYTVISAHWGSIMNTLQGIGEYHLLDDFNIAGIFALDTNTILFGSSTGRFKDFQELLDYARQNPGEVKVGIDVGSVVNLSASVLSNAAGVEFHLVDTGSMANDVAAVRSGQIDFGIRQYSSLKNYIDAGAFKGFAVLNDERIADYPDIPAIEEFSIKMPTFYSKFFFIGLPKNTPQEIVDKMSTAMQRTCENPDAQKEFRSLGIDLQYMGPEEAVNFIQFVIDGFEPFMHTLERK